MTDYGLNKIPKLLKSNAITQKDALNELVVYVSSHKPFFGLQKYDEDFCSEIYLHILEGGINCLNSFNPELGEFSPFFSSYVRTLIHSQKKILVKQNLKNLVEIDECKASYSDISKKYELLQIKDTSKYRVPYNFKPINPEDFKNIFMEKTAKMDKHLLVLAIKSAFYINDEQIIKVSKLYNIDPEILLSAIQYCKEQMTSKAIRREEYISRRNKAYYYHRKYEVELSQLNQNNFILEPEKRKEELIKKNYKHSSSWLNINDKFSNGFLSLRVPNKIVSSILGICERQINYYLFCSKHSKNCSHKSIMNLEDIPED